ncbi:orotidine 5'-phosphate decarboxylase [Anopheles sinensis]|uniref:Orotidine 5'-phosphate decarboxylase n=1 Tax=Anopheles sinensis TaxID=74873 RepID=A0A084VV55_ANOSI|nr:orotidine 5'-phosphate decarboxylase [Anopheles sinensis]
MKKKKYSDVTTDITEGAALNGPFQTIHLGAQTVGPSVRGRGCGINCLYFLHDTLYEIEASPALLSRRLEEVY